MSEAWAIGILSIVVTVSGAVFGWIVSHIIQRQQALEERTRQIELDGAHSSRDLEVKISDALGAIRETLVRIETRIARLEDDDRATRHQSGGRGNG